MRGIAFSPLYTYFSLLGFVQFLNLSSSSLFFILVSENIRVNLYSIAAVSDDLMLLASSVNPSRIVLPLPQIEAAAVLISKDLSITSFNEVNSGLHPGNVY